MQPGKERATLFRIRSNFHIAVLHEGKTVKMIGNARCFITVEPFRSPACVRYFMGACVRFQFQYDVCSIMYLTYVENMLVTLAKFLGTTKN